MLLVESNFHSKHHSIIQKAPNSTNSNTFTSQIYAIPIRMLICHSLKRSQSASKFIFFQVCLYLKWLPFELRRVAREPFKAGPVSFLCLICPPHPELQQQQQQQLLPTRLTLTGTAAAERQQQSSTVDSSRQLSKLSEGQG